MVARGRVLVVDDEPEVVAMLRELLEALGYEVSVGESGEQAISAMATVRPHVVLLDLIMPGVSGVEVLTYFRQHYRAVPVIVVTAVIDQELGHQARAGGAFDVLAKPFNVDTLKRLLAQAMKLAPRA